jgi:hypothetical protein
MLSPVTTLFLLKLALLFFWAAWFCVVSVTNLFSALKAAGFVGAAWKFASTNYAAVAKATSLYGAPSWVPALLFGGVVTWQLAAASLYAWAFCASFAGGAIAAAAVNAAFAAGIGLWAAFMIADEITIKYAYEQSHELLFVAQLASLVAMYVLPS